MITHQNPEIQKPEPVQRLDGILPKYNISDADGQPRFESVRIGSCSCDKCSNPVVIAAAALIIMSGTIEEYHHMSCLSDRDSDGTELNEGLVRVISSNLVGELELTDTKLEEDKGVAFSEDRYYIDTDFLLPLMAAMVKEILDSELALEKYITQENSSGWPIITAGDLFLDHRLLLRELPEIPLEKPIRSAIFLAAGCGGDIMHGYI